MFSLSLLLVARTELTTGSRWHKIRKFIGQSSSSTSDAIVDSLSFYIARPTYISLISLAFSSHVQLPVRQASEAPAFCCQSTDAYAHEIKSVKLRMFSPRSACNHHFSLGRRRLGWFDEVRHE